MVLKRGVAPLAGAWIETGIPATKALSIWVAPLAGAWIETSNFGADNKVYRSHPSRVRGLKPINVFPVTDVSDAVAPLAGAWIETLQPGDFVTLAGSRTPRGCVD